MSTNREQGGESKRLKYCPHCDAEVPKTTFYRHREKYYDVVKRVWRVPIEEQPVEPILKSSTPRHDVEVDRTEEDIPPNEEVSCLDVAPSPDNFADNGEIEPMDASNNQENRLESLLQDVALVREDEEFFQSDDSNSEYLEDELNEVCSDEDNEAPISSPESSENSSLFTPLLKFFISSMIVWQLTFSISNAALIALVSIFKKFMFLLCAALRCDSLRKAAACIPNTYKSLLKFVGLECDNTTLFVVCPKCSCVYNYSQCIETRAGHTTALRCSYVAFPNHIRRDQREPCNSPLLKEVKVKNNNVHFVPIKSYPYQDLKAAISSLVANPEFLFHCDQWRNRDMPDNILGDVYDGAVWKDFNSSKYKNFLMAPGHLLLQLNTDWFQPFEKTRYSVGVLYLVVLNLPREQRYKMENIIVVGVIPGPKEPKLTMNSYIGPLVQDLQSAYRGWQIPTNHHILKTVTVKLCIGCIVCDIPATRKLCGFLGHSAKLGCNKCLKEFPTDGFTGKNDYSGYNREEWTLRTKEGHKDALSKLEDATCRTSLDDLESSHGVRYSALTDLPLFEPIRFPVIDPMHNLLLGTSKHVMNLWTKKKLLNPQDLQAIEEKSKLLSFPYDVGRIPCKIGSSFSGFTADQWRLWTTVISPIALKEILPADDLSCWLLFVNACRLLITRIITTDKIKEADQYLMLFSKKFERLYGSSPCSPNMHLSLHLKDCLLDYGPVQGFWCFPFERFNGLLGAYPTNNINVEVQMMNKFIQHQSVKKMAVNSEFLTDVEKDKLHMMKNSEGSLQETINSSEMIDVIHLATVADLTSVSFEYLKDSPHIKTVPPLHEKVLSPVEADCLRYFYEQLYPTKTVEFFSLFYTSCKKVAFANDLIQSGSVVMAYWPGNGRNIHNIDYSKCRVGVVQYFLRHSVKFASEPAPHSFLLCNLKWKQLHPFFDFFGKTAIVSSTLNEVADVCCYMPVQRIAFRCASGEIKVDFGEIQENVFVASSIAMKFCI